jgi:cytoskeleton protein RodZ
VGSADVDGQAARPVAPDPEQPPPADTAEALDIRIVLRAKGENWVEIREQNTDRLVMARLFQPGDTFDVPNTPGLKLLTGNAGGLEILVDGEPVPPLGSEGMVRRNIPLDADQLRSGALAR